MKEYLLWVETKEKDFNISYVRDENKTMDEMLNEIGEFIIILLNTQSKGYLNYDIC